MARITICDRCKKAIKGEKDVNWVETEDECYDLCAKCYREIISLIKKEVKTDGQAEQE